MHLSLISPEAPASQVCSLARCLFISGEDVFVLHIGPGFFYAGMELQPEPEWDSPSALGGIVGNCTNATCSGVYVLMTVGSEQKSELISRRGTGTLTGTYVDVDCVEWHFYFCAVAFPRWRFMRLQEGGVKDFR